VRGRSVTGRSVTGEVGGADNTRILAELGDLDLRIRPVTTPGQCALEGGPRGIEQQVSCF
jgi:hypothetical protein